MALFFIIYSTNTWQKPEVINNVKLIKKGTPIAQINPNVTNNNQYRNNIL